MPGGNGFMNAQDLVDFADRLSDDLTPRDVPPSDSPPPADDSAEPVGLADFLDAARRVDDDRDVLALAAALIRLRNVVDHGIAAVAGAADRLGLPARKHVRSGGVLLKELGMAPAAAYRAARLGGAGSTVPVVARGMRDGAVSAEFGDAVFAGLGFVAKRVELSPDDTARVTSALMVQTTPKGVGAAARRWAIRLAPEEAPAGRGPAAEDLELNEMTLNQNQDGRVEVTIDLDVIAGEELSSALDPLSVPVPEPDGAEDRRSAARRRADGFAQIIRSYLARSERPESGGVLPHVTLIVPVGISGISGVDSAAEPSLDRVPTLDFGGPISARAAELVMCEASVCGAVVDGEGVPLYVGREERLMTRGIRKALAIRDGGCAFPGCGAPVSHCDAHHRVHWKDGGETSVENGVLLCRRHHTLIHHGEWEVFLGRDGHPWFLPPIDPEWPHRKREPIRSHGRRTLTILPGAA